MMEWIQIEKDQLLQGDNPITLKGVNLGSWMNIENFMIGLQGSDTILRNVFAEVLGLDRARAFFETYDRSFITEPDIEFLGKTGFNVVRLPLNYHYFEDDMNPGVYREEPFEQIDRLIDWCKKHGLYVLLDMHAAPGGQNTTWPADTPYSHPLLYSVRDCQDRCINLMRVWARRYKDEPAVLGYDLLNEPTTRDLEHSRYYFHGGAVDEPDNAEMIRFYHRLSAALREETERQVLVIENEIPLKIGEGLDDALFEDPRTMMSFHFYPASSWTPVISFDLPMSEFAPEKLRPLIEERMREAKEFADRLQRPALLGEFGFTMNHEIERMSALTDVQLEIAEDWGLHWTQWSYKDVDRMGMVVPREDTPWMQFVNRPDVCGPYEEAARAFGEMFDAHMIRLFEKNEGNALRFDKSYNEMQRGIARLALYQQVEKLKDASEDDLRAMAESFRFDHCEIRPPILETLKKHLC